MQPDAKTLNLREAEHASVQDDPVAILRIGEGVVAVLALQARIARLLTIGESAEERLEGPL